MFTLHNGDCLQAMPLLEAGSVDAIITDLPYKKTGCKWDSIIPLVPMWEQVKRVLKSNGVFITTSQQPFTTKIIASNYEMFKYEWIWNKRTPPDFYGAKYRPLTVHENVCIFSAGGASFGSKFPMNYYPIMEDREKPINVINSHRQKNPKSDSLKKNGIYRAVSSQKYPKSILDIGVNSRIKSIHPTQKPVALYEYLIKTYTNEGEIVLDIAMGSGTTIEAAERTGRNSIGIEKDEGIFQSAVLRLKSFTPSNTACTRQGQVAPQFDNFE